MENLELKPNKIELSEFQEKVRSKIDDNSDIVVYLKHPSDPYDFETLKIFLENSKTKNVLLDFIEGVRVVSIPEGFFYDPIKHTICMPAEALRDPKEIFSLLHELGHIEAGRRKSDEIEKRKKEIFSSFNNNPDDDLAILTLSGERDAWASAIHQARKIKKDLGINLFSLFKNADEFMGWLRVTGLRNYESTVEKISGEKTLTKDKQVQKYLENLKELNNEVEKDYSE